MNNPPSHVRITGVGESKQDLIETGARLSGFAEALNLEFEFHPLHKMLYDATGGALRDFFRLIRSTNPSVVVMAEQESEHNDAVLEKRVSNSLMYYSAILTVSILCFHYKWWRSMAELGGFRSVEISERGVSQSQMILKMYDHPFGPNSFKVEKQQQRRVSDGGAAAGVTLSWSDQPLYTVSAWVPSDVAGSSSAYQQAAA
ncbi:unnamed protein product [Lactuca saligna]|uniref:DELLA protein n=1 Tax=Lactuca saligna TaxID=75948 RepID=A0AA35ZAF8_LACSI|nr:unnamed protein product [Lactuca saligna]